MAEERIQQLERQLTTARSANEQKNCELAKMQTMKEEKDHELWDANTQLMRLTADCESHLQKFQSENAIQIGEATSD